MGTPWSVDPADVAGLMTSCVISDVSEAAVDDAGGWVTILLASITSTVAAELTVPTNTIGAIAGWGTVTGRADSGDEFEVDSLAASWELAGSCGLPVLFPMRDGQH